MDVKLIYMFVISINMDECFHSFEIVYMLCLLRAEKKYGFLLTYISYIYYSYYIDKYFCYIFYKDKYMYFIHKLLLCMSELLVKIAIISI